MTFKELLDQVSFEDITLYIEQSIRDNENDLRDYDIKFKEVEQTFQELVVQKPTFGHIESSIDVKKIRGHVSVSNMHLGSPTDILSHQVVIARGVEASVTEIVAQGIYQLAAYRADTNRYRDGDEFDDLDPQMARIVR